MDDSRSFIRSCLESYAANKGFTAGILFQGSLAGVIGYHAFDELNLNKVSLFCATGNIKSQSVARGLGFKEEGILRQAEWLYDHYVDHVAFGILKSEWKG